MAKYFIQNLVITGALCAFATTTSFAQAAQTLASAQKAYVNGNWKEAAAAYEQVCPTQADSLRTECYLWNILALSQTGVAADFSKAGKRLDSLIDKTNPQQAIYADLMMTKAQFQMYLGRYNKAAESLVHAIETSQPHQVTVLQKVCAAVQDRAHSEELNEACKDLGNPEAREARKVKAEQAAKAEQPKTAESKPQATETKATEVATAAPKTEPTEAKPVEEKSAWQLQLGAFGVKSNADLLVDNLKKRNISCTITQNTLESGKVLYIVRTGPFDTKENAVDYGAKKLAPLNVEFRPMLVKQAL
ncbi:SPOR domain-containing protein [Fibrobacter sp. UWB12]|uniref:SPOR domain-containing protein n=1 Tax=Fibrobacter sp. UWB12 TaxID=1896203 RepID=UPI000924350F|nr:SPOR domain-containing protein [Fibrobacter sp. UWB12]SHK21550.1 Sporulation related domain-containing protein [Fibrobacter sp. UWB12]